MDEAFAAWARSRLPAAGDEAAEVLTELGQRAIFAAGYAAATERAAGVADGYAAAILNRLWEDRINSTEAAADTAEHIAAAIRGGDTWTPTRNGRTG